MGGSFMKTDIDILHPSKTALLNKWSKVNEFANISPWTTGGELAWLAELASRSNTFGEVGSYKGKSAKAIALGLLQGVGEICFCIDRFQDGTEQDFRRNLSKEMEDGWIRLLPVESELGAEALREKGVQFDAFFIDASHEKADVIRDINLWLPLMRPGGLLCGHDCFPDDPNNGIHQALLETFPEYHLIIDSIWGVRVPRFDLIEE